MSTRIGAWSLLGSPAVAAVMASAEPDWLVLDAQHGRFDDAAVVDTLSLLAGAPNRPRTVVRVAAGSPWLIGRALDAGADGVIVPMVQNAEQAALAASACRYPPLGSRSWGPLDGAYGRTPASAADANERIECAVMVETAEAVAGVDEIAATPGVDMIFVGPFDLALSLGTDVPSLLGDSSPENPLDRIVAACRAHGVAAGAFAGSNELAAQLAARGFDTLAVAVDTMLLHDAVAQQLQAAPR